MRIPLHFSALGVVVAAELLSSSAHAHIHLLEPIPRYPDQVAGENKACPCGVGHSNRICQDANDRSDPDRSIDRVTTFEAGATVTVRWDEYVAHSGRYRIAFDEDGADLTDFNAHPLVDVVDPRGRVGNTGDGSIWELEVTLPETTCENCTLELIQVMDGETEEPVADPVGRSTYYQCADIRIVEALPDPPEDAGCNIASGARASGALKSGALGSCASGVVALAVLSLAMGRRRARRASSSLSTRRRSNAARPLRPGQPSS